MKKKLFYNLLFGLIISCVSSANAQNDSVKMQKVYYDVDSFSVHDNNLNRQTDSIHDDFPEFWNYFRNQILLNDTLSLYKKIHFPLLAFGYEDDDPVYVVPRADANWFLTAFLAENDFDNTRQIEDISCVIKIPWYRANQEEQSVGQMTFKKYSGEWKLYAIYINTKNMPTDTPCSPSALNKETLIKSYGH